MCINWLIWFYYSQELKDRLGFNQSTEFKYELKDTYYMHLLMKIFPYSIRAFFLFATHTRSYISLCAIPTSSSLFVQYIWAVLCVQYIHVRTVLSLCYTYERFFHCAIHTSSFLADISALREACDVVPLAAVSVHLHALFLGGAHRVWRFPFVPVQEVHRRAVTPRKSIWLNKHKNSLHGI